MSKYGTVGLTAALVLAIGSCGSAKQPGPGSSAAEASADPAAAAPAQPAAPAPVGPGGTVVESVHVAIADTGTGIPATVNLLDAAGNKAAVFARTNQQGDAQVHRPCSPYDQFQVEPAVGAYLTQDPLSCASTLSFKVYSAQVAYDLIRTGDAAFNQGLFTEAHKNYSLAAERLRVSRPAEARTTSVRAQLAAGRALGMNDVKTTTNGTLELSPGAVNKLRSFQRESSLPVTGVLDAKTSETLDQVSVKEAQRRAAKFSLAHGAIFEIQNNATPNAEVTHAVDAAVAAPAARGAAETQMMVVPPAAKKPNHRAEVLAPTPASPPQ